MVQFDQNKQNKFGWFQKINTRICVNIRYPAFKQVKHIKDIRWVPLLNNFMDSRKK